MAATPPPIETEALIIGAGPAGLFLAFQLGLQEIGCHLVDVLPEPGGQCAALYPDKPIYDLPGLPVCSGRELTERLLQQLRPFNPPLHLGQLVSSVQRQPDGRWLVRSNGQNNGPNNIQAWLAPTVFIAAGVGAFVPRKEALPELEPFEHSAPVQVCYHGRPTKAALATARHVVVHGGDAAAVELALQRKLLPVDSATMASAEPGLYAVGDINHYPGKRKLIVCAFHEATLAAFAAAAQLRPGQRQLLQYTTTSPRLQQLLGVGG